MAKVNIEAAQNVEISKKIPCEKPLQEQLEIMERYTAVHREHLRIQKGEDGIVRGTNAITDEEAVLDQRDRKHTIKYDCQFV